MARIIHSLGIAAIVAAASACTTLMEPDGTVRSATVAVGSSFVRSIQDSGSYGNGPSTITMTRAPNREWKGQTVGVWQPTSVCAPSTTLATRTSTGSAPT